MKVKNGMEKSVKVSCEDDISLVMKKGSKDKVEKQIKLKESIEAPVKKGVKVGVISFKLADEEIAQFDITTESDVEKISFSAVFAQLLSAVTAL